jgi:hypothetical protein
MQHRSEICADLQSHSRIITPKNRARDMQMTMMNARHPRNARVFDVFFAKNTS